MSTLTSSIEMHLSNCDWLVFDAVGTLIQPNPSVAVAYHAIAVQHGSRLSVEEIGQRFKQAFRHSERDTFPNGPAAGHHWTSSDQIEAARWRWIVGEVVPDVTDRNRCFTELWDHFERPSSWSCFDDVRGTLQSLKDAGYRLAIASNFDSRLHSVCDGHPDLQLIERRFVSSETGFRKPAPEFYSAVVNGSQCPAARILMVGDDREHDVAGPVASGMRALLIDRKSEQSGNGTIRSLRELVRRH